MAATDNVPIKISKRVEKELHQTKVVIRRLPPDFTEEKLLGALVDLPPYNYFYFALGDSSVGDLACSRAYFSLTDEASVLPFRDKYDGLILESEKGLKYRAVVEFAPYQAIPKKVKKKADARIATIEQDADYQAFLQSLEVKHEPPSMAELATYIDTLGMNKVSEVQKTPLIEYLVENHKRSGRSGKRLKPESKKKRSKEASSKGSKDSRYREDEGSKGSRKDSGESKERIVKKREKEDPINCGTAISPSLSFVEDRTDSFDKEGGNTFQERRGRNRHEESVEGKEDGDKKSSKDRTKNKDRPDQAIYSPRGKSHDYDREKSHDYDKGKSRDYDKGRGYKESGRSRDKDGYRQSSKSNEKMSDGRYSRREYDGDDKPRRGRGGWDDHGGSGKERRKEGRRGEGGGYRGKNKESVNDRGKSQSYGSSY